MNEKEKILVAFDVSSPTKIDQDYSEEFKTESWQTEADVIGAIKKLGYAFETVGVFDNIEILIEKIKQSNPNILFNLMESFRGESSLDRDIASFFSLLKIPYTGCGPTGMTLCKNKGLSKQILSYHRIRIPAFVILNRKKPIHRPTRLSFPIFIKPLRDEASYGISQSSFVETDDEFKKRVQFIHETLNQDAIAEEYIDGRELYVSLLGNGRLAFFPIRELKFTQVPDEEPKIATYRAKWDKEYRKRWGIRNQFASPLPNGLPDKTKKLSKKIFRLLEIRGYARLDLRLTPEGEIVFIEANPNPILAEEEDFAESAKKAGFSYPELIQKILSLSRIH